MESARDTPRDRSERLQTLHDEYDREDRARIAAMTVSERLAVGVELSMFAARMRDAFRDQVHTAQ